MRSGSSLTATTTLHKRSSEVKFEDRQHRDDRKKHDKIYKNCEKNWR